MRTSLIAMAGLAAAAVLVGASAGCGSHSKSKPASPTASSTTTSHSSAPAQPTGYTRLLISAGDIKAPVTFKASPPIENPNGKPGAATTFSDDDSSHVIHDTIEVLPDPAAAANALNAAKAAPPGGITGKPAKANVGTGGVTISGDAPDKSKGVTVLLFAEGRAFVTLQFDGPTGVPAPTDFVTDVGQKQAAAIKNGLPA